MSSTVSDLPDSPLLDVSRRTILTGVGAAALSATAGCHSPGSSDPDAGAPSDFDVVVVGAGLSGLIAARALVQKGRRVAVVEASARVGGRTLNQSIMGGQVVDGGGQWVGGSQTEVIALASELGVPLVPQNFEGQVVLIDGGVRYTVSPDDLAGAAAAAIRAELEALAETIPLEAPWSAENAAELDALTVSDWLDERGAGVDARSAVELTIGSTLAASSKEVSLLWFAFYLRSAGGFQALDEDAQQARLSGGAQSLSLRIAEELGERLILGAPVEEIRTEATGLLRVTTPARELTARRVIVAMMPAAVSKIVFSPELPEPRRALNGAWRGAPGMKAHVLYDAPFWREQGLSGLGLNVGGIAETTIDSTPPSGKPGILLAFVNIQSAPLQLSERRAAVLADLAVMFGEKALSAVDYVDQDWSKEPFATGCVSPLGPGVLTASGSAIRAPAGAIHFAGTETSDVWCGYLEGAVRAGKRAAAEVDQELG